MSDMGWPADDSVMADVHREAMADYRLAMTEHQEEVTMSDVYDDEPEEIVPIEEPPRLSPIKGFAAAFPSLEVIMVCRTCGKPATFEHETDRWTADVVAPGGHMVSIGPFSVDMLSTFVSAVAHNPHGRVILNLDDGGRMVIRHVDSPTGEEGDDPPEPTSPTSWGHYEQGEPW